VKRARHNALADMPHYASAELIEALADRIEELEAKRLANRVAIMRLEAKLAKAMEHVADYSNDPHLWKWAYATLAELKGEKDE